MAFIAARVFDYGLAVLTEETDTLHICTADPENFTEAVETYSIAQKMPILVSDPEPSADQPGREVRVSAVTDGIVTATGKGRFVALVDSVNGRLLASGPMATPEMLTAGNLFSLTDFSIGIPAA
jgi:hypothetical protein